MAKNEFKGLGDELANLVQIVTRHGNIYGRPLYKAIDIMDELAKLRKGVNETEVLEACSRRATRTASASATPISTSSSA